jgi:hypothetical protein
MQETRTMSSVSHERPKAKPARRPRRRKATIAAAVPASQWPAWTDRPFDVVALALSAVALSEGGAR